MIDMIIKVVKLNFHKEIVCYRNIINARAVIIIILIVLLPRISFNVAV